MNIENIKMARARIHIICGNCGCNDEWTWKIKKDDVDLDGENFEDDVYLTCGNCATIHSLWGIMPKEDCKQSSDKEGQ